ncbi:hypothetical protein GGI07_000325 [Coemansia sp. Benny D115]|nr:hypothetical protein GGI07_000325 [Coemansia sp. Benny D115]
MSNSQQQPQSQSTRAGEKAADTYGASGSSQDQKHTAENMARTEGILGRVAESASRLASSIACSAAHGQASGFDPNMLGEQKPEAQPTASSSMAREWMAERSQGRNAADADADADSQNRLQQAMPSGASSAASAFRQAARAPRSQQQPTHTEIGRPHVDVSSVSSHQVQLAQNLDGQGVVEFLSRTLPTSMSTTYAERGVEAARPPARWQGPHVAGTVEATDPVAYLQGATYAADMELHDHQVPPSTQAAAAAGSAGSLHSSPSSGATRSWNEHGASVLEEWELNEAWDRAWMDTAWHTAKKPEPEHKAEPVLPSHKNLSYLLKPRI